MRSIAQSVPPGLAVLLCISTFGCPPAKPAGQLQPLTSKATSCANVIATDTTVYDTTLVDERPTVRSVPKLIYPPEAERQKIHGRVLLAATVNADGRIDSSSVAITNALNPLLDAEARRFVVGATLWPACRHGEAVRVRLAVPVEFAAHRPIISMRDAFLMGLLAGLLGWATGR
jgi:TonB family protein